MKNKTSSRGFVQIIIIILAVFALAAGIYYFGTIKNKTNTISPAPTSTPNITKTWIDPQNEFTFSYPSYLSVTQYQDWMYDAVKISLVQQSTDLTVPSITSQPKSKLKIDTQDNGVKSQTLFTVIKITDANTSAQKYADGIYTQQTTDKLPTVTISSLKTTNIADKNVYYYETTNSGIAKDMFLDLNDKIILRIQVYDEAGSLDQNQKDSIINQILSTFKFTK